MGDDSRSSSSGGSISSSSSSSSSSSTSSTSSSSHQTPNQLGYILQNQPCYNPISDTVQVSARLKMVSNGQPNDHTSSRPLRQA